MTAKKAAEIAKVAPSVLNSWQSGSSPTDLEAVKKLTDVLDISFTWLLTGDYEKEHHNPTLAELYQEVPYFDGLARIRIHRLMPRNKGKGTEEN